MSEVAASDTKSLTVQQRATLALGLVDIETTLTTLAESSKSITAITNTAGYDQCHSARMQLVRERLHITKRGKEAREDAQKFSKAVIAEESRLVGIIKPEEERLQKLQDAHDAAVEAAKQARIAAELARVQALQERVAELRGNQMLSPLSGSKLIAEHICDLQAITVDASFEEFEQAAADAKGAALARLGALHVAAVANEAEQERLREEREELVRLRAENVRREAEEKARREAEEREAKKIREAEELRMAEVRRRQKEEDDRIAAERQTALTIERKRMDDAKAAQEAEAKAARDAEATRLRLEREAHEASLRAEREAQEAIAQAERNRLTAEREAQEETARVERERLSAVRAELELAQAALRRQTETPVLVLTPSAEMRVPSSDEIIQVLADHYQVSVLTVADWLAQLDFSELEFAEAS